MKDKILLTLIIVIVALVLVGFYQRTRIESLKEDNERNRANTEALIQDAKIYKTKDSLNAIKVAALQLDLADFRKYREEDAELIKTLKAKNRDLVAVNNTQAATIIELEAKPKDTVIVVRDSILVPAVKVHAGDPWYDFDGILADDHFSGSLAVRDSIVLVESVKYKKFLFWKTKKVKNRQVDVVSRNPHTEILNTEHIIIHR